MTRLRNTKQRQLILEVLRSTYSHPTVDWLYQKVRKEMPNISLGTVYRNLNLLKEQGIIQELRYAGQQSRYDGNPQPHYHLTCTHCQRVMDVDIPVQKQLDQQLKQALPEVDVLGHNLEFYGICPECAGETSDNQ